MRDKAHTEEVKIRLTKDYRRKLENLYRKTGVTPAALARWFTNQGIDAYLVEVSIQTGDNKGSPSKGLGVEFHGTQNAA